MCYNDHEYYLYEQNSQVENTSSIIISCGGNMILKWRRKIRIIKHYGACIWVTDKLVIKTIQSTDWSITIVNILD